MNWYQKIKESYSNRMAKEIAHRATEVITLTDSYERIYIAFNGIPLVLIPDDWSTPKILEKLCEVRQNYINSFTNN